LWRKVLEEACSLVAFCPQIAELAFDMEINYAMAANGKRD
jgi:hypothetical protein